MKDAGRGWKTQTKTRESGLTLENKKPKERETINTKKVDVRPHSVRPSQIFIIFTYKAATGNKNKKQCLYKNKSSLRFLVFEGHVARENKAVLKALWHVWMSCAMVHDNATNKLCVCLCLVHHLHDLHHKQVKGLALLVNGEHRIHKGLGQKYKE